MAGREKKMETLPFQCCIKEIKSNQNMKDKISFGCYFKEKRVYVLQTVTSAVKNTCCTFLFFNSSWEQISQYILPDFREKNDVVVFDENGNFALSTREGHIFYHDLKELSENNEVFTIQRLKPGESASISEFTGTKMTLSPIFSFDEKIKEMTLSGENNADLLVHAIDFGSYYYQCFITTRRWVPVGFTGWTSPNKEWRLPSTSISLSYQGTHVKLEKGQGDVIPQAYTLLNKNAPKIVRDSIRLSNNSIYYSTERTPFPIFRPPEFFIWDLNKLEFGKENHASYYISDEEIDSVYFHVNSGAFTKSGKNKIIFWDLESTLNKSESVKKAGVLEQSKSNFVFIERSPFIIHQNSITFSIVYFMKPNKWRILTIGRLLQPDLLQRIYMYL